MAEREVGLDKLKFAEEVGIRYVLNACSSWPIRDHESNRGNSFVRQYYHCVASEGLENLEAFYAKVDRFDLLDSCKNIYMHIFIRVYAGLDLLIQRIDRWRRP